MKTKKTRTKLIYKYRPADPVDGYKSIINKKNSSLEYIEFGILNLKEQKNYRDKTGNYELGLIILKGICDLKVNGQEWNSVGKRTSVFDGPAYGIYIPCHTNYEIRSKTNLEAAICCVRSNNKRNAKLICPDEVKIKSVGRDNWRRDVHDIIGSDVNGERLLVGETVNPPGNWSSYPPHKHDVESLPNESKLEEVYFFKVYPSQGFGIQKIYTADGTIDETYTVKNNDAVVIPKGYHPVASAPGYKLYYLWILAGKKRILQPNDDPDHSWVKVFRTEGKQ